MSYASTLIVRSLENVGCRFAFGIPGGPMSALFHSLSNSKKIRTVITQHEGAAGFMAVGSYLFGQRHSIPIVFATAGPGAVNAMAGITCAWEEKVPVFLLTANIAGHLKGKRAAQDSYDSGIDICRMYEPITARTLQLSAVGQIEAAVLQLHAEACRSSIPVHLNIPAHVAMQPLPRVRTMSTLRARDNETISPL